MVLTASLFDTLRNSTPLASGRLSVVTVDVEERDVLTPTDS
jgi:hypothetical protein